MYKRFSLAKRLFSLVKDAFINVCLVSNISQHVWSSMISYCKSFVIERYLLLLLPFQLVFSKRKRKLISFVSNRFVQITLRLSFEVSSILQV